MPKEQDIRYMGYSVRWTGDQGSWRCTVWLGWNMTSTPRYNFSDIAGLELYDHSRDEEENYNLAGVKSYSNIIKQCFDWVESYAK